MGLRDYQLDCVNTIYENLASQDGNPLAVIPTGGGKTHVLAEICKDAWTQWGERVVVVSHVKELVEQSAEKLRAADPTLPIGVYSSGLGRREPAAPILVAGVQSVFNRADELGSRGLMIIDECHRVPAEGEGMYRTLVGGLTSINPELRIVGLTATPYRTGEGSVYGPGLLFSGICFECSIERLTAQGHLSRVSTKQSAHAPDLSKVAIRKGEYVAGQLEKAMMCGTITEEALIGAIERLAGRRSVLVFAAGVAHAHMIREILDRFGEAVDVVTGHTSREERRRIIERFRANSLRFLVNVNVLTTGFDHPEIDGIVLLRPTLSPGLFYQMVGRGLRVAPEKKDCLVLDYTGNAKRHGPINQLHGSEAVIVCEVCDEVYRNCLSRCPFCGALDGKKELGKFDLFGDPIEDDQDREEDEQPSKPPRFVEELSLGDDPIVDYRPSRERVEIKEYRVHEVYYRVHQKRGATEAPKTLRVSYKVNWYSWIDEWVCIEHPGFAGQKARQWWTLRTARGFPKSTEEAFEWATEGGLRSPAAITVKWEPGSRFPRITRHDW